MGTFLRQLWGRRWSGDRSFQPVPPFGEQASSREKLSSAPGLRAPDRATRGGLRSSESARGDGAQTPISVRKPIRRDPVAKLRRCRAASIHPWAAQRRDPSPPGSRPRRAPQPSHSRKSLQEPPAEQRMADKEPCPASRPPPGRLLTVENQTEQSQAPPLLPCTDVPGAPGQRLCSPAGTRQNRGEHPDKEGEASGSSRREGIRQG